MLRMTRHSSVRSRQRGIGQDLIELVLAYGHRRHCHGDVVFEMRDRSLRGTPYARLADRLRGATVILTQDGAVRTVMWDHRLRSRPGLLRRQRLAMSA